LLALLYAQPILSRPVAVSYCRQLIAPQYTGAWNSTNKISSPTSAAYVACCNQFLLARRCRRDLERGATPAARRTMPKGYKFDLLKSE
jgi:hypothetical protein